MRDFNIGKGVYIWEPVQLERGIPQRILERLALAGVQSVVIKVCDGRKRIDRLENVIKVLRDNNIRVAGWGYSYHNTNPIAEAQTVASACDQYELDMYLIDVEREVEGNFTGSRVFMEALRPMLPDTALGLNTFWNASAHPLFPWKAYLEQVDFVCPQVYWRGERPVEKLKVSQQTYDQVANKLGVNVPMPVVAGDMYTDVGIQPTPEQLSEFLSATQADPSIQGIFMWAADENETTPELWKTFSAFPWRGGSIPEQPIGWGQAKGSLYIRSKPKGSKLGALVKNQLTPIWEIAHDWAAVNQNRTGWVYIGNPRYISLAVDVVEPPPLPPGLYQAFVNTTDGLKVREAPKGIHVRTLRYQEKVEVYEERDGWSRVHPEKGQWVKAEYLTRTG
jgi:hypothetical protein